jgi:hypothetical protein
MYSRFFFLHRDQAELTTDFKPGSNYALSKSSCNCEVVTSASPIERRAEMRGPSDRSREPSDRSVIRRTLGLGVLASLFAVFSRGFARAADALTINPNGEVGIDKLSVQSSLAVTGPAKIAAANTLEFGAGVAGKEVSAGKIGYQTWTQGALDIVGAGNSYNDRKLKFWAEGGATLVGNLTVSGTVAGKGALPVGAILMWSGDPAQLPAGWKLCDGKDDTPDLRERFVVGYSDEKTSDYNKIGAKGGRRNFRLPNHSHAIASGDKIDYNYDVFGANRSQARVNAPTGTVGVIDPPGWDVPVDLRPPYFTVAFIIYRGN